MAKDIGRRMKMLIWAFVFIIGFIGLVSLASEATLMIGKFQKAQIERIKVDNE